jgi:hypothetical protein
MKSAVFVQANVAVNTILTSKVPFLFGNFDVFKKICSKTFIVRCNSVWYDWKNFLPPPGKILRCPFHCPKVPLEAGAPCPPPNLFMLPTPLCLIQGDRPVQVQVTTVKKGVIDS